MSPASRGREDFTAVGNNPECPADDSRIVSHADGVLTAFESRRC